MRRVGQNTRAGFSLVEMLVAIGIMTVLASVMLGYSRSSERQIALTTERDRVISVVNRARELSLARQYTVGNNICGYGIQFQGIKMNVYRKTFSAPNQCDPTSLGSTIVETQSIDPRLSFKNPPDYIFFTSPYTSATSSVSFPVRITLTAGTGFGDTALEITGGGAISPVIP